MRNSVDRSSERLRVATVVKLQRALPGGDCEQSCVLASCLGLEVGQLFY
jgi:hypothetical protein